jgi:hypothetical protein
MRKQSFDRSQPIQIPPLYDDPLIPDPRAFATTTPRRPRPPQYEQLESIIKDLEGQLADLTRDNAQIKDLKLEIELERQMSASCQAEIDEYQQKLKLVQMKNQRLEDQLRQDQMQLDNKRQQANAKEKILTQLQIDIETLSNELQTLRERTNDQLPIVRPSPMDFPERYDSDRNFYDPGPYEEPVIQQPPHSPRAQAALYDNIVFDDDRRVESDLYDDRPTAELQEEIAVVKRQKEALEWQEQRAPGPGVSVAIAQRDRLVLEEKIAVAAQRLGKLRLVLKQRGVPYS